MSVSHVSWLEHVQACGSGGTTAGVALGTHLGSMQARVHAFGVCDDPGYFYDYIDGLFQGLGATKDTVGSSYPPPPPPPAVSGQLPMLQWLLLMQTEIPRPVCFQSWNQSQKMTCNTLPS